jgi:hypothetical protein
VHGIVSSRRQAKMVLYALTEDGRLLVEAVLAAATVARPEPVNV